jgi:hypothetical protein
MQPTYLPWVGYFDLMDQVDAFVILDDVQFVKRSWQHRNRIRTPKGLEWLTVPVTVSGRFDQLISEARIQGRDFRSKHVRSIELNYRKCPYFDPYFDELRSVYDAHAESERLVDLTVGLIAWLARSLSVGTRLLRSSALPCEGKRSRYLIALCEELGATDYMSPAGSAAYLLADSEEFAAHGIDVTFHNYKHPEYTQRFLPFLPYASVVDLLMNVGPRSLDVIRSGRGRPLSPQEIEAV